MTCITRHHPKTLALPLLLFLLITVFMISTSLGGSGIEAAPLLEMPDSQLNIVAATEQFA